jgi:ABC-2 type transport system ATP-binding protein
MNEEPAIIVEGLNKSFILPHQKANSIKSVFTSLGFFRRSKYEIQHALKDISFAVEKGEFFGIVGRNGSGKSTLLKLLAGIYQPSSGSVGVNGKIVPFIELGVGFNPGLSGRDNVYLNGAMLGFSDKEIDEKYNAIVEFAELERFMDQKLKNYSSGMQVRLAFSVATILAESDVLLLDEVLAVGDADFQRKCYKYFKNLKKMNKTVVFVTHDMNAVREYCDRALLINENKVVAIGDTDKITKEYTKLFLLKEEVGGRKKSQKRWGDGVVVYGGIKLSNNVLRDEKDKLTFECKVKSKKDIEGLILGFTIKDSAGQPIFGTNTDIKKLKNIDMKKNETLAVSWTIDNIFNSGRYWIEPAIVYENGMTVSDWWEEAKYFDVDREDKTPYIINPLTSVEIMK